MLKPVGLLLLVFLQTGLFSAFGQEEGTEGRKITKTDANRHVAAFVGDDEKKSAAARETLLEVRAEDRPFIFEALADRKFEVPKAMKRAKAGRQDLALEIPGLDGKKGQVIIHVPKKYSPRKPIPVVFRFHGSGGDGAGFFDSSKRLDCIEVVPTIPTDDRQAWNVAPGPSLIDAAYRHLLANYNIDTNRVYFSGFSAGGAAAALASLYWPQRTAGFYSTGRMAVADHRNWDGSLGVVNKVAGFYAVGLADLADRIEGYRQAEKIASENKHMAEFRFVKGMGHEYRQPLEDEAFDWLFKHERLPYPKQFSGHFVWYSNSMAYEKSLFDRQQWLRVKDPSQSWQGSVDVAVEGQVITLSGAVTHASLALNDQLLNMDESITVKVGDKVVFEGRVERSVEFLLNWYQEQRDPNWLFWNEISF